MELYAGTSGFSYKEWKGSFYPEKTKNADMLAHYASRLPAVEINNTFYRMPNPEMLEGWRDQVPESFRFVLKASRRITHQQRLVDCADSLGYLLESSRVLGARRGPILFQLPPFLKKDVDRLRGFLPLLPDGVEAAFEFRHPSWFDDEVYDTLREAGTALCIADTGSDDDPPPVATADWGYLRLRREEYDDAALEQWLETLRDSSWRRAFVFFKHEDEGTGPRLALRLLELSGEDPPSEV